jgi:hypothetical protein
MNTGTSRVIALLIRTHSKISVNPQSKNHHLAIVENDIFD